MPFARMRRLRDRGFTLIELLVVILIIGILAAVALPSFLNQTDKGKNSEATQLARNALSIVKAEIASNDGKTPSRTKLAAAYNASERPSQPALGVAAETDATDEGRVYFVGADNPEGGEPVTIAVNSKAGGPQIVKASVSADGAVNTANLREPAAPASGSGPADSTAAYPVTLAFNSGMSGFSPATPGNTTPSLVPGRSGQALRVQIANSGYNNTSMAQAPSRGLPDFVEGRTYTLSLWYRTTSATGWAVTALYQGNQMPFAVALNGSTGTWTHATATWTSPANLSSISLGMGSTGGAPPVGAAVEIDDITITES